MTCITTSMNSIAYYCCHIIASLQAAACSTCNRLVLFRSNRRGNQERARAQDDNNTGTYPLQSERFYAALKGHGAPARLVLLPHESHGAPRRLLGPECVNCHTRGAVKYLSSHLR